MKGNDTAQSGWLFHTAFANEYRTVIYMIPNILLQKAAELEEKTKLKYPALAPLAKQCFLNTIETTVQVIDDENTFVITGDIPAMWLRDSAAQLKPYLKYAPFDSQLQNLLRGVLNRYTYYVGLDSYANAFNKSRTKVPFHDDTDFDHELIWERKYEVDSLCAVLYFSYEYYMDTKDTSIFTPDFKAMVRKITDTFRCEQNHSTDSPYYFRRENCSEKDTLPNDGKGNPVKYTGMTWSGFRPSDDSCLYGYLVPANMMAAVALKKAAFLIKEGYQDSELEKDCLALADEIHTGIQTYGTYNHPKYGKIYAFETDGFGHYNLMDDANSPSLLSIPYIGYADKTDEIYQNTRKFILSDDNPYYYSGSVARGIGSPHTPKNYIWHISLIMQILTSGDRAEIESCLDMISKTHDGTNYMHEGFDVNDPSDFSRSWFAWANTLFAQMLEDMV